MAAAPSGFRPPARPAWCMGRFYHDFDPAAVLTCGRCGARAVAGENREYHGELFDVRCPRCHPALLIVPYPTDEETRAAAAEGNEEAQRDLVGVDERATRSWPAPAPPSSLSHANSRRAGAGASWSSGTRGARRRELDRPAPRGARALARARLLGGLRALRRRRADPARPVWAAAAGLHPTPAADTYLFGDRIWTIAAVDRLNKRLAAGMELE